MKENHMHFAVIVILIMTYILTALVIVIGALLLIQDIKEDRQRKKPKNFKISKEVDYILSRGVNTIERSS